MTPVEQAVQFATLAHEGQKRKYTHDDYIIHPHNVAYLVEMFCVPFFAPVTASNMVCAAWLHDVVEDCGVSTAFIRTRWGIKVADMVNGLTERKVKGNREERKAVDLAHMKQQSAHTQLIKCADLIDNTRSIAIHDVDFARVYLKEKTALLSAMRPEVQMTMIARIARSTLEWGIDHVAKN